MRHCKIRKSYDLSFNLGTLHALHVSFLFNLTLAQIVREKGETNS
jgi:hypothetical protein